MTTKYLDNKVALSEFCCRGVPRKPAILGRSSSRPPMPPFKVATLYFDCRLTVSDFSFLWFPTSGIGPSQR